MPDAALQKVRAQSEELMGQVLEVYAREVAEGEVGQGGSARASNDRVPGLGPTGLLYGRIQSGKTAAMITFTASAIDNGFRVVVVLTTNFLELVRQTRDRFSDLGRVIVWASTEPDQFTNETEVEHLRRNVGTKGVVVVCAKESRHLARTNELLQNIGADGHPALILDDEADQASLDNNERKRSRSLNPDAIDPTAVHQAIKDLRTTLRHHVFLQVTATPYALLLQKTDNPLRPRFTFMLEPGEGYTGSDRFFTAHHIGDARGHPRPPIVYVPEQETEDVDGGAEKAPRGLEKAISYFLVASAVQALEDEDILGEPQNFLCHTSHKKAQHERLHKMVAGFTGVLQTELESDGPRARALLEAAYAELCRTVDDPPSYEEVVDDIEDRLHRRKIRVVNSEGKSGEETRGAHNFIIGGNIVGRGLTIPNLLVSYYLRKPKISQMDTMLQHARMFGYREKLMPLTRVFLPHSLAVRFYGIHEAERELRSLLAEAEEMGKIPVRVVGDLRPTRYGVLDTGSIVTIPSGKHLFPLSPDLGRSSSSEKKLQAALREVWPDWSPNRKQPSPAQVDLGLALRLLGLAGHSEWDIEGLEKILRSGWGQRDTMYTEFRPMSRSSRNGDLSTGALNGDELSRARSRREPTLFVFRQAVAEKIWKHEQFYYPTLVFPQSMPNFVYNNAESD